MKGVWARKSLAIVVGLMASGCTVAERLSEVGQVPELRPIEDPRQQPAYQPVSLPMPEPMPPRSAGANSLWREGARGFFKDQRARQVGDILTVSVDLADTAALNNETTRSRQNSDSLDLGKVLGLENIIDEILPNPIDPAELVEIASSLSNAGTGEVSRSEDIEFNIAAIIIQLLPNGNLVLMGRQEIRVNFEVREIIVAGIVRPEDVTPQNTIQHDKIAELRVGYGGRGQLTDVQQPRYGAQVLDIILPY